MHSGGDSKRVGRGRRRHPIAIRLGIVLFAVLAACGREPDPSPVIEVVLVPPAEETEAVIDAVVHWLFLGEGIDASEKHEVALGMDGRFLLRHAPPEAELLVLEVDAGKSWTAVRPLFVVLRDSKSEWSLGLEDLLQLGAEELVRGDRVQIALRRGGAVAGQVEVAGGDLPSSAAVVAWWMPRDAYEVGNVRAPVSPDGTWRLEGLPRERTLWMAVLEAGEYASQVRQARAGERDLALPLVKKRSIGGIVEAPVPQGVDLRVVAYPRPGASRLWRSQRQDAEVTEGRFTIEDLVPGTYDLLLEDTTAGLGSEAPLAWLPGVEAGSEDVPIERADPATLEVVVGGHAAPPGGVELEVYSEPAGHLVHYDLLETGTHEIELPPSMVVTVLARAAGLAAIAEGVTLPTRLELDLEPTAPIAVDLRGATAAAFAVLERGAYAEVAWIRSPGVTTPFEDVPPGSYRLHVLPGGMAWPFLHERMGHVILPEDFLRDAVALDVHTNDPAPVIDLR